MGGGPGGYEAALVAAQLGARVTVVERDGLGGSAVLTDCVPSKALVATAGVIGFGAASGPLGVRIAGESPRPGVLGVDLGAVNDRILSLAAAQSEDIGVRLRGDGIETIRGTGRLLDPARIEVTTAEAIGGSSRPMPSSWRPEPARGPFPMPSPMASASSPGSRCTC